MKSKISIARHSGIYTLRAEQKLGISVDQAWEFLADPGNLSKITPPEMGFVITSGKPERAYEGQIITYKVGVFPGIKSNWVTELTVVKEGVFFIDEQRQGPYRMWHHEHRLEPTEGGVKMLDKISYKVPFGIIGRMVHPFLIRPQLMKIFKFREQALEQIFG